MPTWNPDRLRELLGDSALASDFVVVDEVDSTNDALRGLDARVLIADRQSGGRGRRGRTWHSPASVGLYLSVRFRIDGPARTVPCWTLGVAEATASACQAMTGVEIALKWPNDLTAGGRKLGGVLAELRGTDLIVGLGLNVDHAVSDFPPELALRATSLRIASGARIEREAVAAAVLVAIENVAHELADGGGPAVRTRFERRAPTVSGVRLRVDPGGGVEAYHGTSRGLDDDGALRVEQDDGVVVAVYAAESVTPIEE